MLRFFNKRPKKPIFDFNLTSHHGQETRHMRRGPVRSATSSIAHCANVASCVIRCCGAGAAVASVLPPRCHVGRARRREKRTRKEFVPRLENEMNNAPVASLSLTPQSILACSLADSKSRGLVDRIRFLCVGPISAPTIDFTLARLAGGAGSGQWALARRLSEEEAQKIALARRD